MASAPNNLDAPHQLYVDGCLPDFTLVLNDVSCGTCLARLQVVRSILSAWSPVLRGAMECAQGPELRLQVANTQEVDAWRVAVCLMHPLDPTCGASPSSLLTINTIKTLLLLADKYNMQGVVPHCRDALLSPRYKFAVSGINLDNCAADQLDAFEWIKIAEGVPGFEAVVSRCIQQIVLSATHINGRLDQGSNTSRYAGHAMLMTSMSGLRPDTCAKVAASMASCLATLANMQGQGSGALAGYHLQPSAQKWGWGYSWSR